MKNQKSMFQNPILELLSRSNPLLISVLHFTLISACLFVGIVYFPVKLHVQLILFISGTITWTFAEYLIHRFVFHWRSEIRILKLIHYALHGHHHENPTDKNHLFMPPVPAALIALLLFSFFFLLLGDYTYYFFPGFEFGYLIYSMIHYSVHLRPFSKGIMKKLWIHHGKHHYENSNKGYGVSNTFWDNVFGTMTKNN